MTKLDTKLIGIGLRSDERTGALSTPIYQCATFAHPALGESTGFDYSRTANPTRQVLEQGVAELEGGSRGFAFATGLAALTTVFMLFKPGDHLVVTEDLYGGTYRILDQIFGDLGISATFVDTSDPDLVSREIRDNTRAILVETPTNPLLKVANVAELAALARKRGLLTIVDNTFLTPVILRPLELGADIVVHSGTKYLGGHNDLLAGVVVTGDDDLGEKIGFIQNSLGAVLGAFDSWLLIRGLKTLALRMERQQANAGALAVWLQKHPAVKKVYYPGLPEHPGHELLKGKGFGAMVSFVVAGEKVVEQVLKKVKVISFAESLGGVESLITFPWVQTHSAIPEATRERLGIDRGLLRLSVGAENIEDLIADLEQALA